MIRHQPLVDKTKQPQTVPDAAPIDPLQPWSGTWYPTTVPVVDGFATGNELGVLDMFVPAMSGADPAWVTFQWMPYSDVTFRESMHEHHCVGGACTRSECEAWCTSVDDRVCGIKCGFCTGALGDIVSLGQLPPDGLPPPAAPAAVPSFAISQATMMRGFDGSDGQWSIIERMEDHGPHGQPMWILYRLNRMQIFDHYFIEFFNAGDAQYMQIYLQSPGLNTYGLRFVATLGRIPPN